MIAGTGKQHCTNSATALWDEKIAAEIFSHTAPHTKFTTGKFLMAFTYAIAATIPSALIQNIYSLEHKPTTWLMPEQRGVCVRVPITLYAHIAEVGTHLIKRTPLWSTAHDSAANVESVTGEPVVSA